MLNLRKDIVRPNLQEYKITVYDIQKVEQYKKDYKKEKEEFERILSYLSITLYALLIFLLAYIEAEGNILKSLGVFFIYGFVSCFAGIGFLVISIIRVIIALLISPLKPKEKHYYKEESVKQYDKAIKKYEEKLTRIRSRFPGIEKIFYNEPKLTLQIINLLSEEIKRLLTESNKRENKEWWINLTPRDFEIEVSNYFYNNGYFTELTPQSNDGGVDVIARSFDETIYIQCKHYKSPVSVGCVRELKGVMVSDGVKKGCLACLYGGTEGCKDFAKRNNIQILTLSDFANETFKIRSYPMLNLDKIEQCSHFVNYTDYSIYVELFDNVDDAKNICANNANYAIVYFGSVYIVVKAENHKLKKIRELIVWPQQQKNTDIVYQYRSKENRKNYYYKRYR
ncbi:MAG: restriction endonuclease [Bacteroidaceae bacterium]|nr:restriction endonuclease [Bacteroidaceae bacterium]